MNRRIICLLKGLLGALLSAQVVIAQETPVTGITPAVTTRTGVATLGSEGFKPTSAHPAGFLGDFSGVYAGATPTTLSWDYRTGKGIAWSVDMPNYGQGSPLVIQGKVFLLVDPDLVLCCDALTGKELWRRRLSPLVAGSVPAGKVQALEQEYRSLKAMVGEARRAVLEFNYLQYQVESATIVKTAPKAGASLYKANWETVIPGHRHYPYDLSHLTAEETRTMIERFKSLPDAEVEKMRQRRDALKELILTKGWHGGHDYDGISSPFSITIGNGKGTQEQKAAKDDFTRRLEALAQYGFANEVWIGWLGLGFSTPAGDGTWLYVSFGTGVVASLSPTDGAVRWSVLMPRGGRMVSDRDCASPVVTEDRVYVMHAGDGTGGKGNSTAICMRALDKATGQMLWEQKLPDGGPGSSHLLSYFIRHRTKDLDLFVTNIGPILRAGDGAVVADTGVKSGIPLPTVFDTDAVLVGDRGGDNNPWCLERAMRFLPAADGKVEIKNLWSFLPNKEIPLDKRLTGGCLKVLWHNNQLIANSGKRCDPATGLVVDKVDVVRGGAEGPNPIIAGNYLVTSIADGSSAVTDLATGKIVGTGLVGSPYLRDFMLARLDLDKVGKMLDDGFVCLQYQRLFTATPSAWGGRLYLRTQHTLYCIGGEN